MGPSHTSSDDAVQAAIDLGAKLLIPMHYGTFDLADEALGDQPRRRTEISANGSPVHIQLIHPGDVVPPLA